VSAEFRYDFGGLRVVAAFALPGLVATSWIGDATDIRILLEDGQPPRGEHVYSWRGHYDLTLESCGDTWLVRHDRAAVVAISSCARTLRCFCLDPTKLALTAEIIVRRILPRVSTFFGRFPIHAASLSDGGRATLLLGTSGAGKSTMTAALAHRLGWTIFADDMSVLTDQSGVVAYPTAPGVSVWQASQTALALPPDECQPLESYDGKVWFAPTGPHDFTPQPVEAVILLSQAAGNSIQTRRVSGPPVLVTLALQLVTFNPRDHSYIESLIARLARIVDGLPVYALSYPRDFRLLPAAVDSIRGITGRNATRRNSESVLALG
jgi:hypothetical protein